MCVSKLTIIGSDNGLSSEQHQAIIWTNAGILFILTLGTTSREIVNEIHNIYSRKCIWKCCLFSFNNFFRLTTKETLKLYIINPLWGYKGPLMWELFSIPWCHHDIISLGFSKPCRIIYTLQHINSSLWCWSATRHSIMAEENWLVSWQ